MSVGTVGYDDPLGLLAVRLCVVCRRPTWVRRDLPLNASVRCQRCASPPPPAPPPPRPPERRALIDMERPNLFDFGKVPRRDASDAEPKAPPRLGFFAARRLRKGVEGDAERRRLAVLADKQRTAERVRGLAEREETQRRFDVWNDEEDRRIHLDLLDDMRHLHPDRTDEELEAMIAEFEERVAKMPTVGSRQRLPRYGGGGP